MGKLRTKHLIMARIAIEVKALFTWDQKVGVQVRRRMGFGAIYIYSQFLKGGQKLKCHQRA